MASAGESDATAAAAFLEAARNGEYDRTVAALLAPRAARPSLVALAAFSAELIRIAPATRREPHMGAIRLQWWRETLENEALETTGHPVADAMKAAMRAHRWPLAEVLGIVDSHAHDALADAFASDEELLETLKLGEGALFRLAARALGMPQDAHLDTICANAGTAYGIARRLVALPNLVALGHLPIPQARLDAAGLAIADVLTGDAQIRGIALDLADIARDRLAQARQALRDTERKFLFAFLPLALVETYLRQAEQPQRNLLRDPIEITPLPRIARLWQALVFRRL